MITCFHLFETDDSTFYNAIPEMPRVLGVNQLHVLSQSFPHEQNQALELGTGRKETREECDYCCVAQTLQVFLI